MTETRRLALFARSLFLLAAVGVVSVASAPSASASDAGAGVSADTQPETAEEARRKRAARRLERREEKADTGGKTDETDIGEVFEPSVAMAPVDEALVGWYAERLEWLSDPAREGRAPGTDGIEDAADFLIDEFRAIGLTPAFENGGSYRQEMEMGVSLSAVREEMSFNGGALEPGEDFAPLAYSGSTSIEDAGVYFTGYALRSGPDGYRGFEEIRDLGGAVALCLKYEPMNGDGTSKWRKNGWSSRSKLTYKVNELINRGAGAVLIVSPSMADDDRAGDLDNLQSTAPPQVLIGVDSSPEFDVPVCSVSEDTVRAMLRASGYSGTYESLVERSNEGGVVEKIGGLSVSIDIELDRRPTMTDNLGALIEGRGVLKDEYVVIGAHYDHVGYGRFGSRIRNAAGIIHPGADDNGSGTTALLLAARELAADYAAMGEDDSARSVLLLLFTAEESGLNGSRYYVENPIAPVEAHEVMLNLDMIGGLDDDPLEVGSLKSSDELAALVIEHLDASGMLYARDVSVGSGRSDHASFDAADIPNIFFFTGLHERYHTPDDTFEHVDNEGAVRVAQLVADIALAAARDKGDFLHRDDGDPDAPSAAAPKVRVGIVPSNGRDGGMVILRVFEGTSAGEAGLEPSDLVTHWDGVRIDSVESWSPTLMTHEPGDVVTLTVVRDGETLEIEMTLQGA